MHPLILRLIASLFLLFPSLMKPEGPSSTERTGSLAHMLLGGSRSTSLPTRGASLLFAVALGPAQKHLGKAVAFYALCGRSVVFFLDDMRRMVYR